MSRTVETLIVGLGTTGLSVARHLLARGAPFRVADSRAEPPGLAQLRALAPGVPVHTGPFDIELFKGARRLVVSPGLSVREPAVAAAREAGAEIVGDIELFVRIVTAPVVAITGSNGKSTVTALVGEMARAAGMSVGVGGNIGTPALDLLTDPEPALYVLELSSFQLETTESLSPVAAAVLNLSADHLDRYDDLNAYAAAKARILARAATAVINRDDPVVAAMAGGERRVSFGLGEPGPGEWGLVTRDGEAWLACGDIPWIAESRLRIPGRHNTANALAALALGEAAGLPRQAMVEALMAFQGLPHRCQWVARIGGVSWYNDSKGTNLGATLAALAGFPGPVVLIAGGQGKGQDFTALRDAVAGRARAVVLLGEDAPVIQRALGDTVPVVSVPDMTSAVAEAARLAQTGDSVLLSPACASLDMFDNYQHRGEVFMAAVQELAQ
ncbi:UDP-N-acetylmuramoyl-L-alanine--D-glutamate ligase [Thioalkalivibrio denitrificans]|uniref:UDP-N-acetylmuramoylalanine--D-glutamate ligase n=1 Tax=Thioalkalivibrio denitrificans TaxID=108003 RepID=A0A1V3NMX5_9GAMM|nr:UDP-N-acetylmuramoyl-L-alanine--D-glutamate ligase [Thioalkalivibrio denitrificans]OOG26459.1 UDP-N-acetylmuramoyl-L-alanine--D-glutamate ligase [Thioalkalivibrio denitrificans]